MGRIFWWGGIFRGGGIFSEGNFPQRVILVGDIVWDGVFRLPKIIGQNEFPVTIFDCENRRLHFVVFFIPNPIVYFSNLYNHY